MIEYLQNILKVAQFGQKYIYKNNFLIIKITKPYYRR